MNEIWDITGSRDLGNLRQGAIFELLNLANRIWTTAAKKRDLSCSR